MVLDAESTEKKMMDPGLSQYFQLQLLRHRYAHYDSEWQGLASALSGTTQRWQSLSAAL